MGGFHCGVCSASSDSLLVTMNMYSDDYKQEFCVTLALNKFKYTVGRPLYSSDHYSKTNYLSETDI